MQHLAITVGVVCRTPGSCLLFLFG